MTRVKVHKVVGSLAVASGTDSDVTKAVLGCNVVIDFFIGLYIITKLYLIMLVEVQTTASDDAFWADGAGHPIFSGYGFIQKYADKN